MVIKPPDKIVLELRCERLDDGWIVECEKENIVGKDYMLSGAVDLVEKAYFEKINHTICLYPKIKMLKDRVKELEMVLNLKRLDGPPKETGYYWLANAYNPVGIPYGVTQATLDNGDFEDCLWNAVLPDEFVKKNWFST